MDNRKRNLFKISKDSTPQDMYPQSQSVITNNNSSLAPQAKDLSYLNKDYIIYLITGNPPKKGFIEYCNEFPEWENFEFILITTLCSLNQKFDKVTGYINLSLYENLKKLRDKANIDEILSKSPAYNDKTIREECIEFYTYKGKEMKAAIGRESKVDDPYRMMIATALIFQKINDNEELDLTQYYISHDYIQPIISALKFNYKVQRLYLPNNPIGEEGCYWLGTLLRNNQHIIDLDLSHCKLTDNALRMLLKGLASNTMHKLYLKKINLSENEFTDKGGKEIAELIGLFTELLWLNLCKNKLGNEGFKAILIEYNALIQNKKTQLETLIIHNNLLEANTAFDFLSLAVEDVNCTFKSLVLSDNDLSSSPNSHKYLSQFFNAMKSNTSITEILLINCKIGNAMIDSICDMLCENKKLEKLCLYHNNINAPDKFLKLLSMFCGSTPRNSTLKDLDLSKNQCNLQINNEFLNIIKSLQIESIDISQNFELQNSADIERFKQATVDVQNKLKIIY